MKKKMKFNTRAIHGGQILDPAYGSVMTPIYQTSTYAQSSPGKHKGYEYSRTHNPTRTTSVRSPVSPPDKNVSTINGRRVDDNFELNIIENNYESQKLLTNFDYNIFNEFGLAIWINDNKRAAGDTITTEIYDFRFSYSLSKFFTYRANRGPA